MQKTIPDSHNNRLDYLKNLLDQITTNAATLGIDAKRLAAITALLQPLIDKYAALVTAEDEMAARVKAKLASGLTSANAAP